MAVNGSSEPIRAHCCLETAETVEEQVKQKQVEKYIYYFCFKPYMFKTMLASTFEAR